MYATLERIDHRVSGFLRRWSEPALRFSVGIVFVWFGALKIFDVTPVTELVANTVYWFDPAWVVPTLGVVEVAVGLGLLFKVALRSVLGQHELDEMLAERDTLNRDIQAILDRQTDAWGIKISNVEIKHVDLDESMIRAIAAQAEAERQRRAKVIHATGEKQAAFELVEAAKTLSAEPNAIQLRYLQTLTEIAGDKSSTIVFPLDLIKQIGGKRQE